MWVGWMTWGWTVLPRLRKSHLLCPATNHSHPCRDYNSDCGNTEGQEKNLKLLGHPAVDLHNSICFILHRERACFTVLLYVHCSELVSWMFSKWWKHCALAQVFIFCDIKWKIGIILKRSKEFVHPELADGWRWKKNPTHSVSQTQSTSV